MSKHAPTPQQSACVAAACDDLIRLLKIEACAGAGKTSTLVLMADALPVPSLYLAFNKVTATEGTEKFPKHVTCQTTHSVAYQVFGKPMADKLKRPKGKYVNVAGTGAEIARYYGIKGMMDRYGDVKLSAAFLGLMVKFAVAKFEQSADAHLTDNHIPYGDLKEKQKLSAFNMDMAVQTVLHYAKKLWADRIDLSSVVLASHDTYLKMYQLSKPVVGSYDVLYVDEFQDTTPCVLDIVMNQAKHMKIIMVGDARQAIYGWRGAVNAMQMVKAESRSLTKSFRYGQAVADIATTVLQGAMKIEGNDAIKSITGFTGKVDRSKPYTRLFRTNSALLSAAISELRRGTEVSIEIDVKDFVKLLQSALALKDEVMKSVKHDKILPYNDWNELLEEAKTDAELKRVAKVVNDGDAESWIDTLEVHVNASEPHVTFTTAHKSKGREFSQVIVESDFKSCLNEDGEFVGLTTEEQNLLYVAVTRAINVLEYNQTVVEYLKEEAEAALGLADDGDDDTAISQEYNAYVDKQVRVLKRDVREALAA